MSDSRFETLLGRLLDDDNLATEEWSELEALVRHDPALQQELQDQLEMADLLSQSEDDLRGSPLFIAATRSRLHNGDEQFVAGVRSAISKDDQLASPQILQSSSWRFTQIPWARGIAAAALVALVATLFAIQPGSSAPPPIASITSCGGSLLWIGDGGRVSREIGAGSDLSGGTLEAVSADSWAALEFRDGSNITVSGPALLTLSDQDQKQLHLRAGSLFAKVARQAPGRPMLIHTRTAELEVLGTQLNVEAESATTRLSVNEGRVRLTRLVDGRTAEVTARHQIVASADRSEALTPILRPDAVNHWTSQLTSSMGQWLAPTNELSARLRALPLIFNLPKEGPLALYVVGFGVPQCGSPPVQLVAGSRFRIHGRLQTPQDLRFGITAKHPEGGFGGKFETDIPAPVLNQKNGTFEVEVSLADLKSQQPRFPAPPVLSELQDCYLLTINVEAGLEVMQVELLPPESTPLSPASSTTSAAQLNIEANSVKAY